DCHRLLEAALRENVAFVPGDAFFATGDEGCRYFRLNFSNAQPERIVEGIRRLSVAIKQQMGESGPGGEAITTGLEKSPNGARPITTPSPSRN
ncbi:MAG: hypothetical protein HY023_12645, partial [Chloroflexi bacterium]|nr:hypothetical protein [Chloroflexota bacterium]